MSAQPRARTARTLYAELRELSLAIGATENAGALPGSLVTKTVKGRIYPYHQYRDIDGRLRQLYLGPDDVSTRRVVERLGARRTEREAERSAISSGCAGPRR